MSALLKWLAKHGHTLDEAQRVAAHELAAAKKGIDTVGDTKHFLKTAAPKEKRYIESIYTPEQTGAFRQHEVARKNAIKSFGHDSEIGELIAGRDPRLQELIDAVTEESAENYLESNDPRRLAFKYFQRED